MSWGESMLNTDGNCGVQTFSLLWVDSILNVFIEKMEFVRLCPALEKSKEIWIRNKGVLLKAIEQKYIKMRNISSRNNMIGEEIELRKAN